MQYGQTNRAANAGVSLRAELEEIGFHSEAQDGFVNMYHTFASTCQQRNPILRPSIGTFINHLKHKNVSA